MTTTQKASEMQTTMTTPGWRHIEAMFAEHIALPKDELFEIMVSKPESVTGRAALVRAGRAKGCADLLEAIKDELKILIPTRERGS